MLTRIAVVFDVESEEPIDSSEIATYLELALASRSADPYEVYNPVVYASPDDLAVVLDPSRHCFREDGCAIHAPWPGPLCCCCGRPAEDHTGCDCEDDVLIAGVLYDRETGEEVPTP